MEKEHYLCKISQDIVLKNEKNEVLILKHKGRWLLVGGRLNKNEGWLEGLKREVKEEISTDNFQITGILEVSNWTNEEIPHYGVFFVGEISSKEKIILSPEHTEYAWVKNEEELEKFIFWHPDLKKIILKVLKSSGR